MTATVEPPRVWHSTLMGRVQKHCLAVICFPLSEDRRIFEPGKVAHHVLEQAQHVTNEKGEPLNPVEVAAVCDKAQAAAAEHGFVWRKQQEPPPRPDALVRGRRLAENWMFRWPLEPGFAAEKSFAIDEWGEIVDYDSPDALLGGIIDLLGLFEVARDDEVYTALLIDDYKSAWPEGATAGDDGIPFSLDNVQRRLQAIGGDALSEGESYSAIELGVRSLPRRWRYPRWLAFEEMGILDAWRMELVGIVQGYNRRIERFGLDPERLASPGFGCRTCPALTRCEPGKKHLTRHAADAPLEDLAQAYNRHMVETWRLKPWLVEACDEIGVVVTGDLEVGYAEETETVVNADAAEVVWRYWKSDHEEGNVQHVFDADLLRSYLDGLKLTHEVLKKLLVKLWPGNRGPKPLRERNMALREQIMAEVTQTRRKPKFGIRQIPEPEPDYEALLRESIDQAKEKQDA